METANIINTTNAQVMSSDVKFNMFYQTAREYDNVTVFLTWYGTKNPCFKHQCRIGFCCEVCLKVNFYIIYSFA